MPIRLHHYILLFIPFFLLFYSESIEVGSMSVSQLWKIPLFIYLIYYLFQHRHLSTPLWAQAQYWSSLKQVFNVHNAFSVQSILFAIKFAFLPLLFCFFNNQRWTLCTLRKVLLVVAQYFILTNIPFLLGLKTMKTGLDYGNFVAYSGIFQNQHAMSVIMAICIIIILNDFNTGQFREWGSRFYNAVLVALGAYAMYMGFARTGWLMFLLAIIVIYMPRTLQVKQWVAIVTLMIALVGGFTYMFHTNDHFRDRIVGNDLQTHKKLNIDSGRSIYREAALDCYAQSPVVDMVVGVSYEDMSQAIKKRVGVALSAHNGFVEMLVINGVVGLILMLVFLFGLLAFVLRRKCCPSFRLALAMWVMFVSFQATQGGHFFHASVLYALIFCILDRESALES